MLEPGREMDELVGERVMAIAIAGSSRIAGFLDSLTVQRETPHYSTEDEDAWPVLRKMAERGYRTTLLTYGGGGQQRWEVSFMGRTTEYGHSISLSFADAVTSAALKALGHE